MVIGEFVEVGTAGFPQHYFTQNSGMTIRSREEREPGNDTQVLMNTQNRLMSTDKTDKGYFEQLDEHLSTKKPMERTDQMHITVTDATGEGEIDIDGIEADIDEANSRLMTTTPACDELAGFSLPNGFVNSNMR